MNLADGDRPTSSKYEDTPNRAIVHAVGQGAKDLWQVISALPGHYPTSVRDAVARLVADLGIPPSILEEATSAAFASEGQLDVLGFAIPHPLDFSWRFTKGTADGLLARLLVLSNPSGRVLLLGAPSICVLAAHLRVADRVVLFDKNPPLAASGTSPSGSCTVFGHDLMKAVPRLADVHAVLADPPWYVGEAVGFLKTASQSCANRGTILLSVGPDGVSPSIAEMRMQIIARAQDFGLSYIGIEHGAVSYATPFFERNALRAGGFQQVPPAWRRGDLLSFRKTGSAYPDGDAVEAESRVWDEFSSYGVRFSVRRAEGTRYADPQLKTLVEGDILPTVSRRDVRRGQAMVWTSGNRIFGCEGPSVFAAILRAAESLESPVVAVQYQFSCSITESHAGPIQATALQVERVVQTEFREMKAFTTEKVVGKA